MAKTTASDRKKDTGERAITARQAIDAQIMNEVQAARADGEAIGACKALTAGIEFNRLMKMSVIYRILKAKEYKQYGITQAEFFKTIGEKERSTEEIIKDLAPIFDGFQAKLAYFSGCKFNEIRLLGREFQAETAYFDDGSVEYQGERYEPKDFKSLIGIIAESYEDRLHKETKSRERIEKKLAVEEKRADEANIKLHDYQHINEKDADPWVSLSRKEIWQRWDLFIDQWRAFVLHDNAELNDNAQEFMVEMYDRIQGDLDSINEIRYKKSGNSYTRKKK